MKIDDRIEPLVRAALDAAVHRDGPKFTAALQQFEDEASSIKALELVLSVSAFVLFDVYGGMPTENQTADLAGRISRQEAWLEASPEEIAGLLGSLTSRTGSYPGPFAGRQAVLAFGVAANLLASASRPDDGEWWFNYLDKVEAAIEAPQTDTSSKPSPL